MRGSSRAPRAPPDLPEQAHKGDAGRVLCVVGSEAMPGAAILVARAAQRAGAGLVAIGCLDPLLARVLPPAAPEAVLVDLRASFELTGASSPDAADRLRTREPHAVLVGPGLGDDARTREVLRVALSAFDVPLLLDADALNALDGEPERLRVARAPVVITPHPGEAARLLGRRLSSERKSRVDGARELSERSGAVVCLKGHHTLVAAPGARAEEVFENTTGNAGLATAGTGDVLSGILVAYLAPVRARPELLWTPLAAAQAAVHVHGLAGDLAQAELGQRAVVASDLIAHLPLAQRRLADAGDAGVP